MNKKLKEIKKVIKEGYKEVIEESKDDGIENLKLKEVDIKKLLSMETFRLTKEFLFISLMFLCLLYMPSFYLDDHRWLKGLLMTLLYVLMRFIVDKIVKLPKECTYTEHSFNTVSVSSIGTAILTYMMFALYYKGVLIVFSLYVVFSKGYGVQDIFSTLLPYYLFGVLIKTIENMLFILVYRVK